MAKAKGRIKEVEKPSEFCETCIYIVPDMENLTPPPDRKPILGSCKFQRYKMLLRSDNCEKYRKKC